MMRYLILLILMMVSGIRNASAYSILTHEAIIDAIWDKSIVPLLKQKYPAATPAQLQEAHAYAYGGAVAPDMGYYPLGSKFFTNLTHYVRSGDLIMNMLDEAQTVNEYAFALGWLTHYNADNYGHSIGINPSVPIMFPKLRTKYGDTVTFDQDHISHVRAELSFDVVQVARGNYNSESYHELIGFRVSEPVLKRAFAKTYGLEIENVFPDFSRAVGMFRWSVRDVFPRLTRKAWRHKKEEILKYNPAATRHSYIYRMRRTDVINKSVGAGETISLPTKALVVLMRFVPKFGPLKKMKVVVPGPEAEKLFVQSFDSAVVHCISSITDIDNWLANKNFDTGERIKAGEYNIADDTYTDLLLKLQQNKFANVSPALKNNVVTYCNGLRDHLTKEESPKKLAKLTAALEQLKATNTN